MWIYFPGRFFFFKFNIYAGSDKDGSEFKTVWINCADDGNDSCRGGKHGEPRLNPSRFPHIYFQEIPLGKL